MGALLSRRKKVSFHKYDEHKRQAAVLNANNDECRDEDDQVREYSNDIIGTSSPERQPKIISNKTLLDTPNFDFRIEPVEQQGNKMSKTHYFLVEEPKYRRYHSTKERFNPIEMYANSSRLFCQNDEEPKLPFDMDRHISSIDPARGSLPVRRGRSDTTDYLYNQHRALIARMRLQIPQATDMESHGVLMGTNWNFPEAERRLKMELVHRQNGANYKQCEAILVQHGWDLEAAISSLRHW